MFFAATGIQRNVMAMNGDMTVTHILAYRLCRAYAQGRDRAYELSREDRSHVELCGMEVFNPYSAEPEKSRWNEGFAKASAS